MSHAAFMGNAKTIDEVVSVIEASFAGITLEDGISISEATVIDDYGGDEERANARASDEKMDWRTIPDELIERHYSALTFMDAKGFRFSLPAYMRFVLRHYVDVDFNTHDSVFFHLQDDHDPRRDIFSSEQKAAVRAFLEFFLHEAHGWFREEAAQALPNWQ